MQVVPESKPGQEQDSWESVVSAWIDGEDDIRPEQLDSPHGRHMWDTYHLIGDVLRNEDLAIKPSDLFYARISKAIDAEPPVGGLHKRKVLSRNVGLSSLAIAAAVVSVVWVAFPYFSGSARPAAMQVVATAAEDAGLRDYLDAHRQLAGISAVRQVSFDTGSARQ